MAKRSAASAKPTLSDHLFYEDTSIYRPVTKKKLFSNFFMGSIVGAIFLFVVIVVTMAVSAQWYLSTFSQAANTSPRSVIATIAQGTREEPLQTNGRVNILLLGTDALATRPGEDVLTDTIMLLSLNLVTGELGAVSFPRDLWDPKNQVKINKLYQLGIEEELDKPELKTAEVMSEWSGVEVHHSVVLSMEAVGALIDAVGGVEIDVPETFTDDRYPRSNVDVTVERDPKILYESVTFTQGREVMDGERALKYIRSRKSLNPNQGTDDARVKRQQQVIGAIVNKVAQPSTFRHPRQAGLLYGWYAAYIASYLSIPQAVAVATELGPRVTQIDFEPTTLSIAQFGQPGVIFHPPEDRIRGWIYQVSDFDLLKQEVQEKLGIKNSLQTLVDSLQIISRL